MKVNEVKILCSRTMKAGEKFGEFVKAEVTLTASIANDEVPEVIINALRNVVREETDTTCKALLI